MTGRWFLWAVGVLLLGAVSASGGTLENATMRIGFADAEGGFAVTGIVNRSKAWAATESWYPILARALRPGVDDARPSPPTSPIVRSPSASAFPEPWVRPRPPRRRRASTEDRRLGGRVHRLAEAGGNRLR